MYNPLKKLPLHFKGELHDIVLVNFSVAMDEVRDRVPESIIAKDFAGRALISMVNVKLKRMRLKGLPPGLGFDYQHIGFRLLVKDRQYTPEVEQDRGIYFLDSFTSRPLMAWGGSLLTDYRLQKAEIFNQQHSLDLRCGEQILSYRVAENEAAEQHNHELLQTVGAIDRAYSTLGSQLRVTQIMREKWPLVPMKALDFRTNFFRSAHLEGVFRVPEVIYYQWLPARNLSVKKSRFEGIKMGILDVT
ncbi:MAG: DUF2071 domain-containing protein [Bacteroidota bacterium]